MTDGEHVPVETRVRIREDIAKQVERTRLSVSRLLVMWGISRSTWYGWGDEATSEPRRRYNALTVLPEEEQAIVRFRQQHREVGYRKLTWMMNDAEAVALSESSVYAVLSKHNLLGPWLSKGGVQAEKEYRHKPSKVHQHWHTDLAYIKVRGVFYFLIMILDGYSRYVLGWDLLMDMTSRSVQDFVQRVREKYPDCHPMLINDNGSAFISRDFKMLVSRLDIQQVFTRRNHPETNGKAERWNGLVRQEALRKSPPESYQEAWQVIADFVDLYNHRRLHAGINFLRPVDLFQGKGQQVLDKRQQRLADARCLRILRNKQRREAELPTIFQ